MKFLKALATTACALALAGAAHAATYSYSDSSANYDMDHMLTTGDNGGTGFGAWVVETHGSGDGWAGCGIWDPSANDFQGDWAGKTRAFGIIGKGDSYGVNAYRPFRAPLAVGDTFSLEMAVNWDGNGALDSLKGFALLAKGGTFQALTVNHRSNPGDIAINGEADSEILNAFGTYPMKWTFTAKDATTLHVTATPRDGSDRLYEKDWEVETSAIDGFRLQSSGQNAVENLPQEAIDAGETPQMWADRRQTYFDNFALDVADELPAELVDLGFASGDWAVTNATQELSYTLRRPSAEGELTVNITSSFEAFIPSTTAVFAAGESETTFTVTATLQPKVNNIANLTASAVGCNPAIFENVRAPFYRVSSDTASVEMGATANIWVNWDDNGVRDDSKLAFVADPEGIVSLPASLELADEAKDGDGNYIGYYGQTSISGLASGYTLLALTYDGVVVGDWGFTVPAPVVLGFELSGPKTAKTGDTKTYTLKAAVDSPTDFSVSVTAKGDGTAEVASDTFVVNPDEAGGDGFVSIPISVTFNKADDFTLTVHSLPEPPQYTASMDVTVSDRPDYSKFIAYDDASLYGDFDAAAVGEGTDKFQAWEVVTENSGGIFVGTAAPDASVLTDGKAFGIWANGADDAELQIRRPFVNSLGDGQAFSVVVSPNYRDGTKGVKFLGKWEDSWFDRAEFFYNNDGYFYKLDGDEEATNLGWEYGTDAIAITLKKAADGSSYTLTFARGDEVVAKEGITSFQGTVDAVQFYSYRGGEGDENNLVFNKLAITQAEPIAERLSLEGDWAVTRAIAELSLKIVRPNAEGTLDVALASSDSAFASVPALVTFADGDTEMEFTVTATLTGSGNFATITATAEGFAPATRDIKGPTYTCNAWDEGVDEPWMVSDTRTFWVNNGDTPEGFPADDALVTVASDDTGVVTVGELAAWALGDDGKAYTSCTVAAIESGETDVKVFYDGVQMADYHFTVPGAGAALSGPITLLVGVPATYTIDVTLLPGMTDSFGLSAEGTATVDIDPPVEQGLTESGSLVFTVTASNTGTVTLTPYDTLGLSCNNLEVTVTDDPYANILRITAMDRAETDMVLTVDGTPGTAYGATEIVDGDWAWQPLDDDTATIAGDKVTVDMTGRSFLVIKVEK